MDLAADMPALWGIGCRELGFKKQMTFLQWLKLKLMKVNPKHIRAAEKRLHEARVFVDHKELVTHYLGSGGDLDTPVRILIEAKQHDIHMRFQTAAAIALLNGNDQAAQFIASLKDPDTVRRLQRFVEEESHASRDTKVALTPTLMKDIHPRYDEVSHWVFRIDRTKKFPVHCVAENPQTGKKFERKGAHVFNLLRELVTDALSAESQN